MDKQAYDSAYYIANRTKKLKAGAKWRANNPAKVKALATTWYSNNVDKVKAQAIAWAVANPDKVREADKAWASRNLNKICDKASRRRARRQGAFIEDVDRKVVFLNDTGICQWQYCSEASPFVDPQNWHLDHIQPLSKGGEHSYANTQVMHPTCNIRKGAQ
jgi:hypothetical protein